MYTYGKLHGGTTDYNISVIVRVKMYIQNEKERTSSRTKFSVLKAAI